MWLQSWKARANVAIVMICWVCSMSLAEEPKPHQAVKWRDELKRTDQEADRYDARLNEAADEQGSLDDVKDKTPAQRKRLDEIDEEVKRDERLRRFYWTRSAAVRDALAQYERQEWQAIVNGTCEVYLRDSGAAAPKVIHNAKFSGFIDLDNLHLVKLEGTGGTWYLNPAAIAAVHSVAATQPARQERER